MLEPLIVSEREFANIPNHYIECIQKANGIIALKLWTLESIFQSLCIFEQVSHYISLSLWNENNRT
jgi:hypothetical protein